MTFIDRFWKDKDGHQAVIQIPNLPLIIWAGCALLAMITRGDIQKFFEVTAFISLFIWSYLELLYGKSYFRQILGATVMLIIVYNRFIK